MRSGELSVYACASTRRERSNVSFAPPSSRTSLTSTATGFAGSSAADAAGDAHGQSQYGRNGEGFIRPHSLSCPVRLQKVLSVTGQPDANLPCPHQVSLMSAKKVSDV